MMSKAEFSEEEWTRIKRAPFVAGMAISLADPGGPIELVKETAATAVRPSRAAAVLAVRVASRPSARRRRRREAQEPAAATSSRRARSLGRRSSRSSARSTAIVSAKATPGRGRAPIATLLRPPLRRPPNAAKEGGFLGFHAERVSEGEQRMLDKLAEVLAPPT